VGLAVLPRLAAKRQYGTDKSMGVNALRTRHVTQTRPRSMVGVCETVSHRMSGVAVKPYYRTGGHTWELP